MQERTKAVRGELIPFSTRDGLELHGFLTHSRPQNKKVLLHVHGMSGNFYASTLTLELARGFQDSTWDVFLINTRGAGLINRFRTKKGKKTIGTAFEKFTDCVKDIDAAVKFLHERGYYEIVLSGQSTGCQKITYYQANIQHRIVKALLLLSPADDCNYQIATLGKNFGKMVAYAKKAIAQGKGDEQLFRFGNAYSAKRYLSTVDPKSVEAQLFNYAGNLMLFSKIKCPVLAMFGSKEIYTDRPVSESLAKLRQVTNSTRLITVEIEGADHQFTNHEDEALGHITSFLACLE